MLVSFSVTNFRSFGDEVTLNMVASNKLESHEDHCIPIDDTGTSLLRTAVIYGANAAGKSNLVKAIELAQRAICNPVERNYFAPFRFVQHGSLGKPSTFDFQILIGSRVFNYGFDVLESTIESEWLSVVEGDDAEPIFERNESGQFSLFEKLDRMIPGDQQSLKTLKDLLPLQLRPEQLLLNRVASLPEVAQGGMLAAIIKWFTSALVVLPASNRQTELFDRLDGDERFNKFCAHFLNNVGTGVGSLKLHQVEREGNEYEKRFLARVSKSARRPSPFASPDSDLIPNPKNPDMVIERKLISEHHVAPHMYALPFSQESDGTQALLNLLPILAAPTDQPLIVVLDELDRSLHPLICWEFIEFFSKSFPGAPRQLIVTTHEAHLLNQNLLRRDEYWFAEKDSKTQQTRLTSLDQYKIRNDLKIEKGYLSGRFGAIPIIGGMHELMRLLECGETEAGNAQEEPRH